MIDKFAVVHPSAVIAEDVIIGPWTIIGENVEIGAGTHISSHVVIDKNTKLGKNNRIYSHSTLGSDPQHLSYAGESTWLEIGDDNVIREFVTINRGTVDKGLTKLGDKNYLMSYSHIAHDCVVGNHVIFANTASIAGHVTIGDHAILGAFSGVHQFVNVGEYSFLGRATKIYQDILPFMLVIGNPGAPRGLNSVGLGRHGFSNDSMNVLKQAFQIIFRRGLKQIEIVAELEALIAKGSRAEVARLLEAFQASDRGIARQSADDIAEYV